MLTAVREDRQTGAHGETADRFQGAQPSRNIPAFDLLQEEIDILIGGGSLGNDLQGTVLEVQPLVPGPYQRGRYRRIRTRSSSQN